MMDREGAITDHAILKNSAPQGCTFGCNVGRIRTTEMTYGGLLTEDGKMKFYLGEGEITADPVPKDFFGVAGVAKINGLQDVLQSLGYMGFRHHVSLAPGHVMAPVVEAFTKYLGYEVTRF
jgi:L-fucose isomerase-like protein